MSKSKTKRSSGLMGAATLASLITQVAIAPHAARAAQAKGSDAMSVDATKLQKAEINCDSFCGMLVGRTGEGSSSGFDNEKQYSAGIKGLNDGEFAAGWESTDDVWCANHGSSTNASVPPTKVLAIPAAKTGSGACNVPMDSGEKCEEVNKKLLHCKYHNTQVEQQCLAYSQIGATRDAQKVVLALDLAATATCGTQCGMSVAAAPLSIAPACAAAGAIATTAEVIENFKAQHSPAGHIINGLIEVGGAVTSATQVTTLLAAKGTWSTQEQVSACAAAGFFAIMTGVRTANIVSQGNARGKACQAVKDLASQGAVANPNGAASDVNYRNNPSGGGSGGGGTGANGSGGDNGGLGAYADSTGANQLSKDLANAGQNGVAATSTDGSVLNRAGLDKALVPTAANLATGGQLGEPNSAAGLLADMMGGGGEIGGALAQLAQAAQEHGQGLNVGGLGSSYSGGGNAGGGGSKGAGGENPFANLFGGAAKDQGARGPAGETYGKAASNDIWHAGTTMNLFEIVSSKVAKVTPRVGVH